MRFDDILAPRISLRVKAKDAAKKLKQGDVRSVATSLVRGEFDLLCMDESVTVVPCSPPDVNRLTDAVSTGRATLAQLTDVDAAGGALLTVIMFGGEQLEMGDVEVGVDERVVASLKKQSLDEAARTMLKQSVLSHGGKAYFVLVAGGATRAYLEGEDSERRFAIIGSDIRYALTEREKGDGSTVFLASRITRIRNRSEDPALRLACGSPKFVDWTKAGQRAVLAKAQLDAIIKGEGSYLKKWDEFGAVEGEIFLERARAMGKIPFVVIEERRTGTVLVKCKSMSEIQKKTLSSVSEIDVADDSNLPAYLDNPAMTFEEYSGGVVEKAKTKEFLGEAHREKYDNARTRLQTFHIAGELNTATGEMELKAQFAPKGKWFIYSVAGEVAQMERRAKARSAILTGRAANPGLGLLIEEGGRIPPSQPPPKMKEMTAFVRHKVFPKYPPTDVQKEAIRIALNTPDIALIQGPPGTGKTTVIAAIIERLNEEADKREGIGGHVLLSGFQHDAVENMIDRLKINGLPVPKFGQRSGEVKNADLTRFEVKLRDWCDERANALRKRNPQISESLEEKNIRALSVQYIKAPTLSLAITILDAALNLPERTLGEDLSNELQKERRRLKSERNNVLAENPKLAVVRGIRVTEAGFCDDGPDRAADALCQIKDDLDEAESDLLCKASRWSITDGHPVFLEELHRLKGKLLSRYTPAPVFRTEKVRDSVVKLVYEVLSRIRAKGVSARDKRTEALAELLLEMENNPSGIVDAVRDYSFAFAATCQQSVNKMMQEMKGVNSDTLGRKLEYDFVIVDEAARVSPRDLMVPMSQGKRIILVGDHRQLPQLVDEEVARRMEEGSDSDVKENEWLKMSMFEYLFTERIPKLEERDGVKRRVTLNRQYRMHPDLGDLISRNFYQRHGEKKIEPGLDAGKFYHELPGVEGKCAAWIDIPYERGDMVPKGTSWIRPAEVAAVCDRIMSWVEHDNKRVAERVREWVESRVNAKYAASEDVLVSFNVPVARFCGDNFEVAICKDPEVSEAITIVQDRLRECIPPTMLKEVEDIKKNEGGKSEVTPLSFGVIAFYRAQTDLVKDRLGEKWLKSVGEDRLRIGTVDAFQGREFDVVFLSLVRTGRKAGFGFLKLDNRLNVSMSRQKKLLVAVGDAKFYDTNAAHEQVQGIADFLKLCREKGVVL